MPGCGKAGAIRRRPGRSPCALRGGMQRILVPLLKRIPHRSTFSKDRRAPQYRFRTADVRTLIMKRRHFVATTSAAKPFGSVCENCSFTSTRRTSDCLLTTNPSTISNPWKMSSFHRLTPTSPTSAQAVDVLAENGARWRTHPSKLRRRLSRGSGRIVAFSRSFCLHRYSRSEFDAARRSETYNP